jgi:hypothetical protein
VPETSSDPIDPREISLLPDGRLRYRGEDLRVAMGLEQPAASVASRNVACTNGGLCGGVNLGCSHEGERLGAVNSGLCSKS